MASKHTVCRVVDIMSDLLPKIGTKFGIWLTFKNKTIQAEAISSIKFSHV